MIGKECKGRIHGIGFGPSPSDRSSKSALTDIQIRSSQARDDEVAQLKASLATMEEKLTSFDEMKERLKSIRRDGAKNGSHALTNATNFFTI